MLLISMSVLKNPVAHVSHFGCAIKLPDVFVYFPAGHLVCSIHLSLDLAVLKYPGVQDSQASPFLFNCMPGVQSAETPEIIEIIAIKKMSAHIT